MRSQTLLRSSADPRIPGRSVARTRTATEAAPRRADRPCGTRPSTADRHHSPLRTTMACLPLEPARAAPPWEAACVRRAGHTTSPHEGSSVPERAVATKPCDPWCLRTSPAPVGFVWGPASSPLHPAMEARIPPRSPPRPGDPACDRRTTASSTAPSCWPGSAPLLPAQLPATRWSCLEHCAPRAPSSDVVIPSPSHGSADRISSGA